MKPADQAPNSRKSSQESGELREDDDVEQEQLKHETGLNCSDRQIYNIYLSGNRLTRHRLKKETGQEEKPQQPVSKVEKSKGKPKKAKDASPVPDFQGQVQASVPSEAPPQASKSQGGKVPQSQDPKQPTQKTQGKKHVPKPVVGSHEAPQVQSKPTTEPPKQPEKPLPRKDPEAQK